METKLKLILIGDTSVGKTALLTRKKDNYYHDIYTSTLGVDFFFLNLTKDNNTIKVYIWDTAGQEKFSNLINVYFRNLDGVMLLYDITNINSFNNLNNWLEKISIYNKNYIPKLIVGTKCDLEKKRKVDETNVFEFVKNQNLPHILCSSKENINIDKTFNIIIDKMLENKVLKTNLEIVEIENNIQKKKCCIIL